MAYVVTADTVRLDRIARAIYGSERNGTLEALLSANPGLARRGLFLPRGAALAVPPRPPTPADPALVRPWE